MAIKVQTNSGHQYTYIRFSNSIIEGYTDENISEILFNEKTEIHELPYLSVFTIELTTRCNLRCTYCCYSGSYRNTRSHGNTSMTARDIDSILDFIENHKSQDQFIISFYGGECLLEFDIIEYCVEKSIKKWSRNVHFEISTNGTLLNSQRIDWCVGHDIKLFLSLDGTKRVQDRQRITAKGKGSYELIEKALTYIKDKYPKFFRENINLMMTVTDITELPLIAKEWYENSILRDKLPIRISTVSPNYALNLQKDNLEVILRTHLAILDYYQQHPQYKLLKVYFERFLAEWINRPIFDVDTPIDIPTCLPLNQKLFFDTKGQIGICEKVPDIFRIGTIKNGLNWNEINNQVRKLSNIIISRCKRCPVARVCDICPNVLDLNSEEMDIYCHNQKISQETKLRIFCEMAERGLL